MSDTISAVAVATVMLAIVGMVSLRRMLLKAAYRAAQGLVTMGVAITAALSYKPQWVPSDISLALERLRPAFAGSEQQFWLVIASALLLLGLPLIAYLDAARRADDLTLAVSRLAKLCQKLEEAHTAPEAQGKSSVATVPHQTLNVLADVARYVKASDLENSTTCMVKDYFLKPNHK